MLPWFLYYVSNPLQVFGNSNLAVRCASSHIFPIDVLMVSEFYLLGRARPHENIIAIKYTFENWFTKVFIKHKIRVFIQQMFFDTYH